MKPVREIKNPWLRKATMIVSAPFIGIIIVLVWLTLCAVFAVQGIGEATTYFWAGAGELPSYLRGIWDGE